MFTEVKKGKWNYMFLAAVASLAIAALATLFTARITTDNIENRASHENEQVFTGRYVQYNETVTRFIN